MYGHEDEDDAKVFPGGVTARTDAPEETRQHHKARHARFEKVSLVISQTLIIYRVLGIEHTLN